MMNKEQKWIEKHPITWLLMQKIGEFLWFFAKFSVCNTCTRGLPPHLYDCGRMQRLNSRFRHGFIQTGYRSINQ